MAMKIMTKYKIELLVGLFTIFGIISLLILIMQISDFKNIYKKEKIYTITAIFKNVGTLKKKARVTIGGVKIGKVGKIELKKNNENEYYPQVELLINENFKNIPVDSSINILMSSLLGDSYIQIDLGNENSFLKDGDIVTLTTQALIIEDVISKLAFNK
jgi:phospholipid/cholesterol/gamma-HCH transport system substrate-binding protein